jgi:hypothetical protein
VPGSVNATVATGAGPGVMAAQVLGGPVWWFVFGLYLLTIALAVFVLIDSQRPARREALAAIPEPSWLYAVFTGVYLVVVVGVWIPAVPRIVAVVPVVLTPIALALSVAYLLRVVFPKPASAMRTDADAPHAEEHSADETHPEA